MMRRKNERFTDEADRIVKVSNAKPVGGFLQKIKMLHLLCTLAVKLICTKYEISGKQESEISELTWSRDGTFTFAPGTNISIEHARCMDRALESIDRAGPNIPHSHRDRPRPFSTSSKSYRLKEPPTAEIVSAVLKARSLMRDHRVRFVGHQTHSLLSDEVPT